MKVENVIKNCKKCNAYKIKTPSKHKNVQIKAKDIFEKISTDTYGPFNLENLKHEGILQKGYFITITDIYSRITEIYFTYQATGNEVLKCFKNWIKKYKKPSAIISDNGTEFKNSQIEAWLNKVGIKHVLIPPYSPFANGISEAINKTIAEVIKMKNNLSIRKIRKAIKFRLNENTNRTLGTSPNSLLNGHNFFDIDDRIVIWKGHKKDELMTEKYKINDEVYVKNTGDKNLDNREYLGPYKITEIGRKQRWVKVEGEDNWVHVRNIKP